MRDEVQPVRQTLVNTITGGQCPRYSLDAFLLTLVLFFGALPGSASGTEFLQRHWPERVAPQGDAPAGWSELETSMQPEACGQCHVQQYEDWHTSRHSLGMGPGVAGQLVTLVEQNPWQASLCWSCHAPLGEQQSTVQQSSGQFVTNPAFDADLQSHGVTCVSCHVRERDYFGPPRRGQPNVTGKLAEDLAHGGFTARPEFTQSAFCKGCHQFDDTDHRLNGKLIENTWREWIESQWAAQGVQCQDCHMPDRRHLWRGIHDHDMVRSAFTLKTSLLQSKPAVDATIEITNSGAGHNFPTYITPKVYVTGQLLTEAGVVIAGSEQSYTIGWESYDLVTEVYDTRLAPGESRAIAYRYDRRNAAALEIRVIVAPDHWYRRFFVNWLQSEQNPESRQLIRQALEDASNSRFVARRETIPLD